MRKLACLLIGVASVFVIGCSKNADPDEAQIHKMLDGPPSLEGMAKKHPVGARQAEKQKGGPPAAAPGTPPVGSQ